MAQDYCNTDDDLTEQFSDILSAHTTAVLVDALLNRGSAAMDVLAPSRSPGLSRHTPSRAAGELQRRCVHQASRDPGRPYGSAPPSRTGEERRGRAGCRDNQDENRVRLDAANVHRDVIARELRARGNETSPTFGLQYAALLRHLGSRPVR